MKSTPLLGETTLDRYPGFSSFKTTRGRIHYQRRWIRDALIQASLDPQTVELAPSSTPVQELPAGTIFAFRRRDATGLGLVLVTEVTTDMAHMIDDDRVTVVSRMELRSEPRFSSARAIWTHKRLQVDSAQRYRAIEAVSRRSAATLREVLEAFRNELIEPVHQICSLLANSYLEVDLDGPLKPSTILRLGPAARTPSGETEPIETWSVER
jgi:hypothetical protein